MQVRIAIDKRLYDDLVQYCNANDMDIEKYCTSSLRKQLSLDKYGDLNAKLLQKEEIAKEEESKIQVVEAKPFKQPEVVVKSETKVEVPKEIPEVKEEPKQEKRHRTIKTK